MFVPAGPTEIPWREAFFSVVVDFSEEWTQPGVVARELWRVITPGGAISVHRSRIGELESAGFIREGEADELTILRKPA
jgi:hypothetical protein